MRPLHAAQVRVVLTKKNPKSTHKSTKVLKVMCRGAHVLILTAGMG